MRVPAIAAMNAPPAPRPDAVSILVVNPNRTHGFTEAMREHLSASYPVNSNPPVKLSFLTAPSPSPTSISSVTTSIQSAAAALPAIQAHIAQTPTDGILIACFSAHPLVPMLRELTSIPTVGIMQSAIVFASQIGGCPGVVTTDARWEPLLTHEIRAEGLDHLCGAGVISSGLAVLDLERLPQEEVVKVLADKSKHIVESRGADVIVLGCAGMVGLDAAIKEAVGDGVEVIDPVRCGLEMALSLARMRCRNAKRGVYEAHS